jgi:hypothetical protein
MHPKNAAVWICAAAAAAVVTTEAVAAASVRRGEYLAQIGGCADCHTPMKMGPKGPMPDSARGLSGHPQEIAVPPPPAAQGPWAWGGFATNTAFWGPWGISYAINLTPDVQTGIGSWKVEEFVNAMRTGKHLGTGRPILPPMPWPGYGKMTDEDLRSLFAYLTSQPAVRNLVPHAVLAPPPKP